MKAFLSFCSAAGAACLVWTHAHPALVVLAVTSAFGFLHDHLASWPRIQGLAKVAKGMGVDESKIKAGILQFLTGVSAVLAIVFVAGCGSATPAALTPDQARAQARGAVETEESAWLLAAQACVDAAELQAAALGTPEVELPILTQCRAVLGPAKAQMVAAAQAVDAWQADAGQTGVANTVACELQQVSKALAAVSSLGLALPSTVKDAQTLADSLVCAGADGGK